MPPAPASVTCSGCGSAVPAGDRFCGSCGNPITGSALLSGEGAAAFDPWVELLQKLRQATLGEYEIKGELGRGGMAAVFLAHDLHLNRKVAIKVMLPGLLYSERMWERFLAEARTAAKLDHPNIIYIHSVKEKDRFLYFVMKYVDGRPLDDILSRAGQLPAPVAQTILVEVARALDYAHREGVIHRDIKPANIMIDQKGNAIVMDFGIARVEDSAHFTQTGATIGTPAYMSPEQCHGHEVTAASDQYSLGIVAYEMLAGRPPFRGSPIELQLAHIQDIPRPIRELRPDLSAELASAVTQMLEKDPAKRLASLTEAVRRFSHCCDLSDPAIRAQIADLVKDGPPRRQSFTPTPVSPTPGSVRTVPQFYDDVRSAETTAVPTVADDAHSRPTAAIASGETDVMPGASLEPIGAAGLSGPAGKARGGGRWLLVAGGALAVVAVAGVLLKDLGESSNAGAPADSAAIAEAPPSSAAAALEAALGDSAAVGHGAGATTTVRGRAPRTVSPEAVALLTLSIPARGIAVGDTVRARLEALDDEGLPVTTPQIVWSTSNPRVLKFAGAGVLVGVSAGRATVTTTAGTTTGTLAVTVAPARSAAKRTTP